MERRHLGQRHELQWQQLDERQGMERRHMEQATRAAAHAAVQADAALRHAELRRIDSRMAPNHGAAPAADVAASAIADGQTRHFVEALPVDVFLPRTAVLLRDVSQWTDMELGNRLASRPHSCIYMPVILAAVGRPDAVAEALIVHLTADGWWANIVAAAARAMAARLPVVWADNTHTYAHPQEQERLLGDMEFDAANQLRMFCATLPSARERDVYLDAYVAAHHQLAQPAQPPAVLAPNLAPRPVPRRSERRRP